MSVNNSAKWKHDGVRVIPGNSLDPNTAQSPGMDRKAAINFARVGAQKIWAGTVSIQAERQDRRASSRRARKRHLCGARQGAHALGRASGIRRRSRPRRLHLRAALRAASGDQRQLDQPLECVVIRSDNEAVVVNLDIDRWRNRKRSSGSIRSIASGNPAISALPRGRGLQQPVGMRRCADPAPPRSRTVERRRSPRAIACGNPSPARIRVHPLPREGRASSLNRRVNPPSPLRPFSHHSHTARSATSPSAPPRTTPASPAAQASVCT